MPLDAEALSQLVPMVSILSVFGMPVAIVWTVLHFRMRHRELDAAIQARRELASDEGRALEARATQLEERLQRIEGALFRPAGELPAGQRTLAAERLDAAIAVPPPEPQPAARAALPRAGSREP